MAKASYGEQEWYFFSRRNRKYPNGDRPNRSAGSGYWKATGTDKPIVIMSGTASLQNVGVKKSLVFYRGSPLKSLKTNWIIHEYRLDVTKSTRKRKESEIFIPTYININDATLLERNPKYLLKF